MKRIVIEILLIVAILALAGFGLWSINRSFNATLAPLKQGNADLSTQVSQLLHPTPTIIAGDRAVVGFEPSSWDVLLARTEELQRKDPYELPDSLGPDPYRGVD